MQKNYNENLVAGAAIRDDKGRRISKLFEASHPKMTVGYAKNLIMPDTPAEQEFNFRQSGGGVIEDGVAVIDKVKGNSVVWNQLLGGEYGVSETELIPNDVKIIEGHKYLVNSSKGDDAEAKLYLYFRKDGVSDYYCVVGYNMRIIFTAIANGDASKGANVEGGLWFYKAQTAPAPMRIFLTDLTQMFGTGNEPATVEEFLSRKPKVADEYAYNEGTIINNKVEAVVTTGRNLWDEQLEQGSLNAQGLSVTTTASIRSKEFNRCLPNCEICFSCQSAAAKLIYWYDVNKVFISRYEIPNSASIYGVTTSPANAYFFKVRNDKTTYNHDICINLSDPAINGKYFPYEEHTLDLSWIKEIKDTKGVKLFEDGMRSVGNAFDEVAKGRAIKRIGVKVFDGTEDWALESINSYGIANFRTKGLSKILSAPLLSAKYPSQTTTIGETQTIGLFNANESSLYIRELSKDFASVDAWKAHLADLHAAGTPLVVYYGLDTPIEVEYDEKNLTYPVVAGGTEEAIASEPSTAFRADIGYGIDAVKTILDLKARVAALEGK